MANVLLMTGSWRCLGRETTEAAPAAGDYVVATANKSEYLKDLVDRCGGQIELRKQPKLHGCPKCSTLPETDTS
jgi:hypothetical protein